ncbi:MAG: O-antigen ligase family protein [Campylobacteraceae bacterium]|nr:O-antigen ligase family protein [Campylobacteraceae bacterium]
MNLQRLNRIDYINYIILLYAFVLSFPVAIKTPILVALIILWLSDTKNSETIISKETKKIFIFMTLFFSFIVLSILWSEANIENILIYIKKNWYFLPIFIIYKYLKKEYITYALSCFLLGMLVSEILSYGVFFSLWKIRFASTSNPSIFLHHIQYSIFLSLTSIILFFRAVKERSTRTRIIYSIFFTTVTINLFINIGRTGYITFLIGMFLSLSTVYKFRLKVIFSAFTATISIIVLAYVISPNFQTRIVQGINDIDKMTKNSQYNSSIGARFALWSAAEHIFLKNPILGVGVAQHIEEKNKFAQANKKFEFLIKISHFHNSFLEILTQFGLVGLFLFIYILFLLGKIPIKDTNFRVLKISLLSIFILGSFSDRLFHLNSTMSLFAFMSALILTKSKYEK